MLNMADNRNAQNTNTSKFVQTNPNTWRNPGFPVDGRGGNDNHHFVVVIRVETSILIRALQTLCPENLQTTAIEVNHVQLHTDLSSTCSTIQD